MKKILLLFFTAVLLVSCSQAKATNKDSIVTKADYQNAIKGLQQEPAKVVHVRDGDTIDVVTKDNKKQAIRMLLLDTPESVKKDVPVMPYGKESSEFTKRLLENKDVTIVYDKGQKEDPYKRLLAYVFVDGECVEAKILRNGYGIVRYINKPNTTLLPLLQKEQEQAKKEKINVWSKEGYVTSKGYNTK
ncbi:thermonuclease family protein [Bacillus cereus]|uniref:thermonuclease family protein n=1 Tax=Bacillus cereus TaxID=1396 RepID=UPI000BF525CC|nr:thermonuclease family protein [Bacillus cereus]PEQ98503.1 hypothetical protein CN477_26305 [Bacillus cereus]